MEHTLESAVKWLGPWLKQQGYETKDVVSVTFDSAGIELMTLDRNEGGYAVYRGHAPVYNRSFHKYDDSFFRVNKTYTRKVDWSISAQALDAREEFTVHSLHMSNENTPLAWGERTTYWSNDEKKRKDWIALSRWHFNNERWKIKENDSV